jgi:hypothetical protein
MTDDGLWKTHRLAVRFLLPDDRPRWRYLPGTTLAGAVGDAGETGDTGAAGVFWDGVVGMGAAGGVEPGAG